MSEYAANPEQAVDDWLVGSHEAMSLQLRDVLDTQAGLYEVVSLQAHAALGASLDQIIGVESGLSAIFEDSSARIGMAEPGHPLSGPMTAPQGLLEVVENIAGLRREIAGQAFRVDPVTKDDLIQATIDPLRRRRALRAAYHALAVLLEGLAGRTITREDAFGVVARTRESLLSAAERVGRCNKPRTVLSADGLVIEALVRKVDSVERSVARLFDSTDYIPAIRS